MKEIPQFDLLTLGSQIFGLLISFYAFYYYSLTKSLFAFIEIKKIRTKKILQLKTKIFKYFKDLNSNLWINSWCVFNNLVQKKLNK